MNKTPIFREMVFLITFLFVLISCNNTIKKPNIIYFFADDLGYGEVGVYGQRLIATPHMDALAKEGMLFTQHYAGSPVCGPSRACLLTGKHSGHTSIRGNDADVARGDVWNYKKAALDPHLEGQRAIIPTSPTLGVYLQKAGYVTGLFGKWGLGGPLSNQTPNKQGFDVFYGYNCQRQAHNLRPYHLWENDQKVLTGNTLFASHRGLLPSDDPLDPTSYKKYTEGAYAPALIHEKALGFIRENKQRPFFLYYASPLPHVPLQAPREWIDRYRKIFGEEKPYTKGSYYPTLYPRATYAAMISYLDSQLGQLLETLKEEGIYDHTIIIVSSDNGPTYTGGVDAQFFKSTGKLTGGYGRTKGFVYEGGIRVPMIVTWKDRIARNTQTDHISANYDILPTLCDLLNIKIPSESVDGISFKNKLLGVKGQKKHDFLYWEFPEYGGQQAVRIGKWKGIRQNIHKGNLKIALYDLSKDVEERQNVSALYPDVVQKIKNIMTRSHQRSVIPTFHMKELGD